MKKYLKSAGVFALTLAVSVLVLWGMDSIAQLRTDSGAQDALRSEYGDLLSAQSYEEVETLGTADYPSVERCVAAVDDGGVAGYIVTQTVRGYGGQMQVICAVSADGSTMKAIRLGENSETAGIGSLTGEQEFTSQFENAPQPFTLGAVELKDGNYTAQMKEFDSSGFRDTLSMSVNDGRITAVIWDAESRDGGKSKRELSQAGQYVMTEGGLAWHEQAKALEQQLIDTQAPARIEMGNDGKTDAISGVSISISPFIELAQECFVQAGGGSETYIDAVSGATVSSSAMCQAANTACQFVREYIGGETDALPDEEVAS